MANKKTEEKIILGIDPGTQMLGYGLIKVVNKEISLVTLGHIDLKKFGDHYIRLQKIFERVSHLINHYLPDEFAIEAPFYGKNVQSMLKLGRAQGVAMAAALARSIPVTEYQPRKVKQAITGNGNASKEQVAAFLQNMLKIESVPTQLDSTDGLAVAVCHHLQNNVAIKTSGFNSWKDFINKNPGRVLK